MTKKRFCLLLLLISPMLSASMSPPPTKQTDVEVIERLYQHLPKNASLNERLHYFSNAFLGEPYLLGPLGEGQDGLYNRNPLFRIDAFDCLTFVETVMALAESQNATAFEETLKTIRYQDGQPTLTSRNHFTSLDWIPNNTKKGFIKDITKTITDANNQAIYLSATTIIDKKNWYRTLGEKLFKNPKKTATTQTLFETTDHFKPELVKIDYLPLSKLFNKQGRAIASYFSQIPDGSIVMIVRPDWQIKDKIGTNLHISHLGFAEWDNNELYFVQASILKKNVVKIKLSDYLSNYLESPTVKGINLQKVLPPPEERFSLH